MKQTLPEKLLSKFEKLNKLYTTGDGNSVAPIWLLNVIDFLEEHRHRTCDMPWLRQAWHRQHDSASNGNWADQMIHANEEYKNMISTANA